MKKILFFTMLILVLLTACSASKPKPVSSIPDTGAPAPVSTQTPLPQPTVVIPTATTAPVEPTQQPAPTQAATQIANESSAEVAENGLNLRVGPGLNHRILGVLQAGDKVRVEGRSVTGEWIAVQLPDGREGWVYATYLKTQANLAALPVLEAYGGPETPAKPTAIPSKRYTLSMVIENNQAEVRMGNFPAESEITLELSVRGEDHSMTVATGKTGADGSSVIAFEMPRNWPDGTRINQHDLVLTAASGDGSIHRSINISYDSGE